MDNFTLIKILFLTSLSFIVAFAWAPILTHYLYKYKIWKKEVRTVTIDNRPAPIFSKLHKHKEVGTPRMGGLLIWVTTLFVALLFFVLSRIYQTDITHGLNFLTRSQTWLPLFTLVAASFIGLVDDLLVACAFGRRRGESKKKGGGIRFRHRLFLVTIIGLIGGWWFFSKLEWDFIHIPFIGDFGVGFLFIPFFVLVMLALFGSCVMDGLDGLSGGVFSIIFGAYTILCLTRGQFELATLCGVIAGSTLAFLWFNIPPARFYMSETGILGLTTTVAVVAFFTNTVFLLPLFCFIPFITVLSDIIQLTSKKLRNGKKVFLAAPIHHHFEAMGWPAYKVTMRFWVVSSVTAVLGVALAILDAHWF